MSVSIVTLPVMEFRPEALQIYIYCGLLHFEFVHVVEAFRFAAAFEYIYIYI